MAKEYFALTEETDRGTDPGGARMFLPLRSTLRPAFDPTDEIRKEFRGHDTAKGGTRNRRLTSGWTHSLEANLYPVQEIGLLLKHVLGFAGARSVVDVTAYEGILYPLKQPFGAGNNLVNKAIGMIPNTDEEGTTKSQYFGGGRLPKFSLKCTPDDEVVLTFEAMAPGPYVGAADQAATAGVANPAIEPFLFDDVKFYIGPNADALRTGVGPDFTVIGPGTLVEFSPDDFNLTFTSGLEDKSVGDGVAGKNKTERSGPMKVEGDFSIDYRDSAAGFNSAAEFKKIYDGPLTNSLMVVLTHTVLAGAAAEYYQYIFDIPLALMKVDTAENDPEGKTPIQKFTFEHQYDPTIGYPLGIWVVDQVAAY